MLNTLKNLNQLAELYEGNREETNEALKQAAEKYKKEQKPETFSFIYSRIFKVTAQVAKSFSGLHEEEKASISTEVLHEALLNYELDSKQSVQYYFSICYRNKLLNRVKELSTDKRKASQAAHDIEDEEMFTPQQKKEVFGYKEDSFGVIELIATLKTLNLNKSEMAYCTEVIMSTSEVKNIDVANKLNISGSAVNQLKAGLRHKLKGIILKS